MDFNKNYKGSYIFSEVLSSISKNTSTTEINSFPSLDFLEKKNSTINSFNNIDFYCLIDIQKEGNFILEKDISLNIGFEKNSINKIIDHIDGDSLRIDAEMDKTFTEFHINHHLAPLDMVLSNINPMVNSKGEKFYLKRTLCILSNDQSGIPLFGFCAITVIDIANEVFDPKNFTLNFTTPNLELERELRELISKSIN